MKTLKFFFRCLFFLLVIASISFLYYLFPSANYLTVADPQQPFLFKPLQQVKEGWYHLTEYNYGGEFNLVNTGRVAEGIFYFILTRIFPPKFAFFFALFFFVGLGFVGMFFLLKNFIFKDKKEKNFLSFLGAGFFALNLFVATFVFNFNAILPYLFSPWIIICSLLYIEKRKFAYLFFSSFLVSSLFIFMNVAVILIALLICFWTAFMLQGFKKTLIAYMKIGGLAFLLSLWWIVPVLTLYFNTTILGENLLLRERFYALISSHILISILMSYWESFLVSDNRFGDIILNTRWLYLFLSTIFLLSFFYITKDKKEKRLILLTFLFLCIGFLLSQGYHDASFIKEIYRYLIDNSVFFGTFRNNYKFVAIVAFCYAILLPYSYLTMKKFFSKQKHKIIPLFIVFVVLFLFSFPFWTGRVVDHFFYGFPQDLKEVTAFLNSQPNETHWKILILPGTDSWYRYRWLLGKDLNKSKSIGHGFTNRNIFVSFLDSHRVIYRYGIEFYTSVPGKIFVDRVLYEDFLPEKDALAGVGIKYLLLDKTLDLDILYYPGPLDFTENYLDKKFEKIYESENYSVYLVSNKTSDKFLIPEKVYYFQNDSYSFLKKLDIREAAVIKDNSKSGLGVVSTETTLLHLDLNNLNYGCFDKNEKIGIKKMELYNTTILSIAAKDICVFGNKNYSLDLTGYDSAEIILETENPQKTEIFVFFGDGNIFRDAASKVIYLKKGQNIIEMPFSISPLIDAGINVENIKEVFVGLRNFSGIIKVNSIALRSRPSIQLTGGEIQKAKIIGYKKINPIHYEVEVNAEEPFLLVFLQSYSPFVEASVNGKKYKSIEVYSTFNGFVINETGKIKIKIYYTFQKWFYYALTASAITFVVCVVILFKSYNHKNSNQGKS